MVRISYQQQESKREPSVASHIPINTQSYDRGILLLILPRLIATTVCTFELIVDKCCGVLGAEQGQRLGRVGW